jgi:ribose 5-phosphate isomerase A
MSEVLKRLAGEAAVEHVKDGMVLGLGTGSTVYYTILKLGELVRGSLEITGVPTSVSTEKLARERGIPLTALEEHPVIDLTIDGADEVDPNLDLIKGMGGALLREKVVASASKRMIVVVDDSKIVEKLGTKSPVPVEVVPFALSPCMKRLAGMCQEAKLRERGGKVYVTDNGNNIIDCWFDGIQNPAELERELNLIPGVMENGLFLGRADLAVVGGTKGLRQIEKPT